MFVLLFYIFKKVLSIFVLHPFFRHFQGWDGPSDNCKGERDNENEAIIRVLDMYLIRYSKTCVKRPLKNRQNNDLNNK